MREQMVLWPTEIRHINVDIMHLWYVAEKKIVVLRVHPVVL